MLYTLFFSLIIIFIILRFPRGGILFRVRKKKTSPQGMLFRRERKTERFEIVNGLISLKKRDSWSSLRKFNIGSLEDLSLSGFRCRVPYHFRKEDKVIARIEVPAFKNSLNIEGEVCWSRQTIDGDFILGVTFSCLDDYTWRHLQLLKKYDILKDAGHNLLKRLNIGEET